MSCSRRSGSGADYDVEEVIAEREQEFHAVSEALRIAQGDRQHFLEEVQSQIRRMRNEIVLLEQEREELTTELKLAESNPNIRRDQRNCEDLANLADNKDWLDQQMEDERAIHAELDSKIKDIEKNTKMLQLNTGGYESRQIIGQKNQKWLTVLENRLNNVNNNYNSIVTENSILRSKIDSLRCERGAFDQVYKKLDHSLHKLRLKIAELTSVATEAYEQREEAHAKMLSITEKTEKDIQQHYIEMKELIRFIDQEKKLKIFMNQKRADRVEDPLLTAWKAKRAKEAEEKRLAAENSIDTFITAFDKIGQITGEKNEQNLVNIFIKKEDRNFALYNYINELNSEIKLMELENDEIKNDINQHTEEESTDYKSFTTKLKRLQRKQAQYQTDINSKKEKISYLNSIIDQYITAVGELFKKMGCSTEEYEKKLAVSKEINRNNVMDFLKMIELRGNELLDISNYISSYDTEAAFDNYNIIGNGLTGQFPTPKIKTPHFADDYDCPSVNVDPDNPVPLLRRTFHRKVMKVVRQKESEGKNEDPAYPSALVDS